MKKEDAENLGGAILVGLGVLMLPFALAALYAVILLAAMVLVYFVWSVLATTFLGVWVVAGANAVGLITVTQANLPMIAVFLTFLGGFFKSILHTSKKD